MKFFVHPAYLAAQALFEGATIATPSVYLALGLNNFIVTDLNAMNIDSLTGFTEYDGSGYARQNVTGITVIKADVFYRWALKANNLTYGILDAATQTCKHAMLYFGTVNPADDATNVPVCIFDNTPDFPFNGDGTKNVNVRWAPAGIVIGPNCP